MNWVAFVVRACGASDFDVLVVNWRFRALGCELFFKNFLMLSIFNLLFVLLVLK